MNKKQRDEFWKGAVEYEGDIPNYRFHDEWFYMVTDSAYTPTDAITLRDTLDLFEDVIDGETCSVYLYRGRDHMATYNGGQSEPEGEIYYDVTKSALPEWLAALAGR